MVVLELGTRGSRLRSIFDELEVWLAQLRRVQLASRQLSSRMTGANLSFLETARSAGFRKKAILEGDTGFG